MTYYDQLFPWVVYRLLPNCQRLLLERFRKRNDAEAYLHTLNLLQPSDRVEIVFEVQASEAKI